MIERVKKILQAEADTITSISVGSSFAEAMKALLACKGKVITTGIGKAGYIAQKAASTFSTTGTPSIFLHPGDASHGDVGVIGENDILLAFSNSGKTREVLETTALAQQFKVQSIISVTAKADSPLGELSNIVLELGVIKEPCPFGLTPTASTAAMLAITDALALVTMEERGFTRADFALRHHGGYLGEKLRAKKPL